MVFGVVAGYYIADEKALYYPDLWTLIDKLGATIVFGAVRRYAADEAAEHGKKMIFSYTAPVWNPSCATGYWTSKEAMIEHLKGYNISQYKDHDGVFGHCLTAEPNMDYSFDPRNPDAYTLNLIEIMKAGVAYIKSQDPNHPVWVAINCAGAYYEGDPAFLEKRIAWINLFIDWVDILDFHYYRWSDGHDPFTTHIDVFRTRVSEMMDVLVQNSRGKPIIIGEMGCQTGTVTLWSGKVVSVSEDDQLLYYQLYGEETKKRDIMVIAFRIIEPDPYGLFKVQNDGVTNIPKKVVPYLKEFLDVSETTEPVQAGFGLVAGLILLLLLIVLFAGGETR